MSDEQRWDDDERQQDQDEPYQWDEPREGERVPEKKKGWSTTAKVLVVLSCIAGGCLLLCCGGFFYVASRFQPIQNPAEVREKTQEIVEIEVLPELQPLVAIDAQMFGYGMRMAVYQTPDTKAMLMLMELLVGSQEFDDAAQAEVQKALEQQQQQQQIANRTLRVEESEARNVTIRGKEVEFFFEKCEDVNSKEKYRRVRGGVKGKEGFVAIVYQVDEESYDEAAVIKMLESIK